MGPIPLVFVIALLIIGYKAISEGVTLKTIVNILFTALVVQLGILVLFFTAVGIFTNP